MKIKDLKIFVTATPPPYVGGRFWVFVKLTTDNGITGIGEVYAVPFHPNVVAQMIEDVFQRLVYEHDPFRVEMLHKRLFSRGYTQKADLSMMAILSGLETACWDIMGKATGKPVYDLLGGRIHERLRSYTYIWPKEEDKTDIYADPALAAERAAEYVSMGFTGVKFDPTGPYTIYDPRQLSLEALDISETFVKAIREAVGTKADLLFGTHGQPSVSSAIRLARRLEAYDPLWFEEPCPPENADAMQRIAAATTIPLATGERLSGKQQFFDVLKAGVAIVQPAVGRCGGLLEGKKIATLAEAHYAHIAPHLYCGPVEAMANMHLDACSPNFLIQESILTFGGFHADILKKPIQWEEGYLLLPDEPGLGIELNEELADSCPYNDDPMHLEMQQSPLTP